MVIWSRPKTVFVGRSRLEASVSRGVASFNAGASHTSDVMDRLAIEINTVTTAYLEAKYRDRIYRSQKSEEQVRKQGRKKDSDFSKLKQARQIMSEGSSYEALINIVYMSQLL